MDAPKIPEDEASRILSLCGLEILDTADEERFDRLTRIAKHHFQVPIALVSLVDSERQWFKSRQGLDATETPRDISFCGHSILSDKTLYVPNALEDERFADNPLVTGPPDIRFYAGVPLHAPDGARVGTLCIIDNKPRNFTEDELVVLRDLAGGVESELSHADLSQVQKELAYKEQQLQYLDQLSPGVIYTFNSSGENEFSYISSQVKNLLGYSSEELITNPSLWIALIHPKDRGRILNSIKNPSEQTQTQEYRIKGVDGNYLWIHDRRHLASNYQSDSLDIVGLWVDITDRKELELESKYYKSIIHSSDDAIISKSLSGIITSWNPGAENMFGYLASEAIGKPMHIIFPPERVNEEDAILSQISQGYQIEHFESTRQHKNGSLLDVSVAISPIFDQVGNVTGASTIARDITDNKNSERRLKDSESRIRAIVENVVDGIITIDVKGTVHTMNLATEKIFGYTSEEVIGNNVKMLMPVQYSSEHDSYINNYLTSGEKKVIGIGREVTGMRKNGSTFPMELAVSEMVIDGQHLFTGIVRDITERKKVENLKNEFVSTVSHELRTPLTSIRGALGLILGKFGDQLPQKIRNMIEMANRNGERLTLLINDILDLEKIESGQLEFEFKTENLTDIARQAIEENTGYAQKHKIKLVFCDSVDPAFVSGDKHRLLQVFANLISNAVKFSTEGSSVKVSVLSDGSDYRVSVLDYGKGIPASFRNSIFQRFAQADSSDTKEKGGTGLGLNISKAIIEHHKGSIGYESEVGKGSEFYFSLPVVAQSNEKNSVNHLDDKVLICEDDLDVAEILKEMVSPEGITCTIATTIGEARNLLKTDSYRLLLLDLILPDENGLDFLQELRSNPATADLPVIIVSIRAQEGRKEFTGDSMMVVDWLQKPVDQTRLLQATRAALRKIERPRILHIEDDFDIIEITKNITEDMADFYSTPTLSGARELLASQHFDLVILDLSLADGSGVELLDEIKNHCPVVIFSAQIPSKISKQVSAALTKSLTSNEQLKQTINDILISNNGGGE